VDIALPGAHGPARSSYNRASDGPNVDKITSQRSDAGARDHFIPARKIDVIDALIAHGAKAGGHDAEKFRQLARLLGAIYHYEYFDQLERLRNDYFYFNPEIDARFDVARI
jgi:hypothetical protein